MASSVIHWMIKLWAFYHHNLQFAPIFAPICNSNQLVLFCTNFFSIFFVALRLCQFAACFVRISAILTIMCLAGGYAVHFASCCSLTLLAFVSPEIWARSSVGARLCDATTRVNRADFGGLRELKKQFDVVRCAEYPLTPSEYRVWTCQSRCDFWTFDTCCSLDNQKALWLFTGSPTIKTWSSHVLCQKQRSSDRGTSGVARTCYCFQFTHGQNCVFFVAKKHYISLQLFDQTTPVLKIFLAGVKCKRGHNHSCFIFLVPILTKCWYLRRFFNCSLQS